MATIKLDDSSIRVALIARLKRQRPSPLRILEELTVHNGKAIADVVTVFKTPHCYEIKGDADSISRAVSQSAYFDTAFKRITLVTTERHIASALRQMPDYWGLVVGVAKNGQVSFRYLRKAASNPKYDASQALLTLWKAELLEVANVRKIKRINKLNRSQLALSLAEQLSNNAADEVVGAILLKRRYEPL